MAQMGREWVWLHPRRREPHSPLLPLAVPPTSSRHSGIPAALTRGMRSNARGWAWHHLMSKLLQAASFFFFLTYLLSASWQAASVGKRTEKGLTLLGSLQIWCCNESQPEPTGMGRGGCGMGPLGIANPLQPVCHHPEMSGDKKGFAARDAEGSEHRTHNSTSSRAVPSAQAAGRGPGARWAQGGRLDSILVFHLGWRPAPK